MDVVPTHKWVVAAGAMTWYQLTKLEDMVMAGGA